MRKNFWIFALAVALTAFVPAFAQQDAANRASSQLPPEQAQGQAPLIGGAAEAPAGLDGDVANYPTNSSLGYKGVVMANFNDADANDELYADFGTTGLWYYNNGAWTQVSGLNPDEMISATMGSTTDDELIVDFGATGLWLHDNGTIWIQLSGVNAEGIIAADDDYDGAEEIQVDFGATGVWRNDTGGAASWTQVSGLNPYNGLKMDVGALGWEEVCWSFPSVGVWNVFTNSSGTYSYNQLTGTANSQDDHASAQFTDTAGAEDLVMDFGTLGLWLYGEGWGPWVQISSESMNRIKEVKFVGGSQDYELLAEYNSGGLYWGNWNGSTFVWTLITSADIGPGFCETFDRDGTDSGDEEVIIPDSTGGAYIFDYSAGSTLNPWIGIGSPWYINFVVKGDYYNKGRDSTLAVAFSSSSDGAGLWLWETSVGWTKISGVVPNGIY